MNKKILTATSVLAAVLLIGGGLYQAMAQNETPEFIRPVSAQEAKVIKSKKSRQLPLRAVAWNDYFYEDFEEGGGDELTLPEGWVTTATSGNEVDKWQCGTLSSNGNAINGASGWQYAFVLGRPDDKAHDTWLFTPSIHLSEGTHYLDFYTYMPPAVDGSRSVMEVKLCSGQSAETVISDIVTCDTPVDIWTKYVRTFTADKEDDYVIGFRCASPANTNAILLDNVRVSDGENPLYRGYDTIEVGDVDLRIGKATAETIVWNTGNFPLSVKLKECSPEITVVGLPLEVDLWDEIEESSYGIFSVTVNLTEPAEYEGYVLLETNDPLQPEVKITVTAIGKEYSVSNYIAESFEYGQPNDWELTYMSFILKAYGAQDGANSWYSATDSSDRNPTYGGIGFTTNYVELGAEPVISFWYKAYYEDWKGNATDPASVSDVKIRVLLNDDNGDWNEVYVVAPGTEVEHNPVFDFQKIEFSIPEYSGETHRIRLVFSTTEGGNDYSVLVDNFKAGTSPDGDITLTKFEGPSCLEVYETGDFKLTIVNQGSEPIGYAGLQLKKQSTDAVISRFECPEIEPFGKYEFNFQWTFQEAGSYDLVMFATNWNDPNEDNNTSYPLHISVLPTDNTPIVINDGDEPFASSAYPVNFNSLETQDQTIYYANELGINKGIINSIQYVSSLNEAYLSDTFSIYVAETDKEDFSDAQFIADEEFTKVFEGNVYLPEGINDFVIPFSEPYNYKGGNLVIMSKREAKMFMYGINYKNVKDRNFHERSIEASALTSGVVFGENAGTTPSTSIGFPELTVNMTEAANGSLEGNITDEANMPVEGAKVTITGTQLHTYTDADGHYSLPKVAAGSVTIDVEAKGYYPITSQASTVTESSATTINVALKAYPHVSLTGKVTTGDNHTGVEGVCVVLDGYEGHRTYTDAEGNYEINGIAADTGIDYSVSFEHPYFRTNHVLLTLNEDATQDMELVAKLSRPSKLRTTSDEETDCQLTWNEPLAEYSYDSGIPSEFVGWNGGHAGIIAGVKFLKNTEIEEVSWYCSSTPSGHEHYNVIIFGLFPDGRVNPNNILYVAEDVENTDDAWSTHRLTRKIKADGYMVAISCDGFLSIGVCEPTEETPFEKGQYYYAGVDFTFAISEMSEWKEAHYMIRAYGTDKGEWSGLGVESTPILTEFAGKPAPDYNIYRYAPGTPREEWTKIATVSETSFTDPDFEMLDKGDVRYSVTAVYESGESIEALSDIISKTTTGVLSVGDDRVEVRLEGSSLVISDASKVAELSIYTLSGVCAATYSNPGQTIDLSNVAPGMLVVTFRGIDGKQTTFKVVK
ncbi:MAG: hypothetical protein HDR88_07975 [Bacteroides sp.]|nr:hypothetical protein [Bacteroides sp.]